MLDDLAVHPALAVTTTARDQTVTVYLRGDLDVSTAAVLTRALAPVLEGRPGTLVFDLAGLDYLDCAGGRVLTSAARFLPAGQRPLLRSPQPVVARLLQLTGLDQEFTVEPADPGPDLGVRARLPSCHGPAITSGLRDRPSEVAHAIGDEPSRVPDVTG